MTLKDQLARAFSEYERTLDHFHQTRRLLECERLQIARAVQAHGLEAVLMALVGARHEPKSERFDPSDFVNLDRYLLAKNFKRFVGLGAKYTQRRRELERPAVALPNPEPTQEEPADLERVKAIMGPWFKGGDR